MQAVRPGRWHAAVLARHRYQPRPRSHHDPVAGVLNLLHHQRRQPAKHHTRKIISDAPAALSNMDLTTPLPPKERQSRSSCYGPEDLVLGLVAGSPGGPVDQFDLQGRAEVLHQALMSLCHRSLRKKSWCGEGLADLGEDLADDVALEQPNDFVAAESGGGASGGVLAGSRNRGSGGCTRWSIERCWRRGRCRG
jgi:hypothetical protein